MSLKKSISLKILYLKKLILNKKLLIFIVMIVFAASIFRFAGVWDGLPYTNYHADEGIVLYEGLKQIDSGIGLTDNLTYPAFSKYTFAFLISPYIIQLIGKEEIARLGEKKLRDNENLYKILKMGRIIFVFFGIFLLLVCFKISNIFEERKAVALLFYLGFCPAFVITGWYLLPGMEGLFFEYLAILSLFFFIKEEKRKYLVYFAILAGIAMSCKYSSYYLYVFSPYLYFKYLRGKIGFLILLLLIPVTTFFLTTPEALFHFGRFIDTLGYQNNISLSGLNKITWLQGIPQYFIGWPLLIAGLIGFILSLWRKKSSFVQVLAIYFLFRLFISLVLQSSYRIYYRNEIELALILLIYASFFTSQISSAIEKILKKRRINFQASYAYYSTIVLLTISPFLKTVGVAKMVYSQKETRIQAGEYINKIQKECPSCKILVSKELEILPRYLNDKIVVVPQEDIPVLSKRQLFDYVVTPTYLDGGREKVNLEEMGNVNFLIDRMSKDWNYRDFMYKVLGVYQGKKNGSLRPVDISLRPLWSRYDVNPTIAVLKEEVILAESVEKEKVIRMEGAAFIEESFDSIKREIKRTVAQKGLPSIEETFMLPKMGFPAGEYEVEITAKKESPNISDDFSSKIVIEMKSENGEVLKSNEFELDDSFCLYRTGIFRANSYESISISISKKTYGTGRSLYLNGKDKNFVIIPDSPTLNSNEITLEAWVFLIEPIEIGGVLQAPLVSKNGINGYYLRLLHNDHSPNFSLAGEWELANGGEFSRIPLKRWVHVAATADGRRARVFVNGYDVSHPFHSKNGGHYKGRINSYGYPLIIGSNSIGGEGCYIGVIDEVRIWNRSLSDEEIKRNITWDLVTPKKGLIAYYKFEGDESNIIKDHSGNNNNGKLKKIGSDSLNFIHTMETLEMKNSDTGWLKMLRIKKLTKPSEEKFYYNQKKDDLYIKKE